MTVHTRPSWTVVDDRGLPVAELEQFLHWLRAVGRSQNTVRSYARRLSLFYRWLSARAIAWDALLFAELCDFVGALSVGLPPLQTGRGTRSPATVKAVSAARARRALTKLRNTGQPITFVSVAVNAGVSTSFLYQHTELRQAICDERRTSGPARTTGPSSATVESLRTKLEVALHRNRHLADEVEALRAENAVLRSSILELRGRQLCP